MDINATMATPVLNISGRRAPGNHQKSKQTSAIESSIPRFQYTEFPSILSRILLKSEAPAIKFEQKYLGVLCLKNTKTNIRMYHMFYTKEKDLGKDYRATEVLYENQPDIKPFNNVRVCSVCPRALHNRARMHFTDYKWNKDGNVLITPISETDEWTMSRDLHSLRDAENLKLFNYIKFLKKVKVENITIN